MEKRKSILYISILAIWGIAILSGRIIGGNVFFLTLIALTAVSFIQNMAFTLVSRSRNSGDPDYHRYAAWGSNGVWLLTQAFIAANIYTPITNMVNQGADLMDIVRIGLTFIVYAISTSEGSVFMMKLLLGYVKVPFLSKYLLESGKRQVGAK